MSTKLKGKVVGVVIGDDSGRRREKGNGKGCCSRMAAGVAWGTGQENVHLSRDTERYMSC